MSTARDDSVLLYDGLCGFCDSTVQFVLAHDAGGRLRYAALQGRFAEELLARHGELRRVDSLMLVRPATATEPETVLVRSAAVLAVAQHLGGIWSVAAALFRFVPRPVRDIAYDAFARVRFRVFGRRNACRIPTPAERARFLD